MAVRVLRNCLKYQVSVSCTLWLFLFIVFYHTNTDPLKSAFDHLSMLLLADDLLQDKLKLEGFKCDKGSGTHDRVIK